MSLHRLELGARTARYALAATAVAFVALSVGTSLTRRPGPDEGWFASPAFNLITTGSMGTPVIEPTGSNLTVQKPDVVLRGINERTYWIMPLHILAQAGWYKIVGFSFFTLRALSTLWGLVALLSWFAIMRSISGDARIALLTSALVAFDYFFVVTASFGRMDMMSAALGFAGIAAYLHFRTRSLTVAVALSQTFVAASGLTHPNGILAFAGVLFLSLYLDRARLRRRHFAVAAVPYLVGAAGWGLYILQSPGDFLVQFAVNGGSSRVSGFAHPFEAVKTEIVERYLGNYGLDPDSRGPARVKILILVAYAAALVVASSVREIRRHEGYRALLILTALYFVIETFFNYKLVFYLVHIVPFFAAILAVCIHWCWTRRVLPRRLLAAGVCAFLLLQVGWVAYGIRQNAFEQGYMSVVNCVRENSDETTTVMGSAELGIALRFPENFVDDVRLGYHSGKRPDIVVVSGEYEASYENNFRVDQPDVYRHIRGLLADYDLLCENASYKVYARRPGAGR